MSCSTPVSQEYKFEAAVVKGSPMVREMFSWQSLDLLIPINHSLNATTFLCMLANHVYGHDLQSFHGYVQLDIR